MNIYEIFNKLRYHHEDEVVEFKKAENNFDFDDLGKYFSALSNEANLRDKGFAWLVFGVHDKTREILGTSYKNSMKSGRRETGAYVPDTCCPSRYSDGLAGTLLCASW